MPEIPTEVTAFSSEAQRAQECLRIDRRIQELESGQEADHAAIVALKTRRNGLTILHRLPVEIMSLMFSMVYRCCMDDTQRAYLTLICKHWYNICIDCVNLWNHIDFSHPRSVEVVLARSKDAKITVLIPFWCQANWAYLKLLVPHNNRIRELFIDQYSPDAAFFLRHLVSAPDLEYCDITLRELRLGQTPHYLLSRDFLGNAPRLHTLRLDRCFPHLEAPFFCNLTNFALINQCWAAQFELGALFAVLRAMPQLSDLQISFLVSYEIHGNDLDELCPVPIPFPRLHVLHIAESPANILSLLRIFDYPPTTTLELLAPQDTIATQTQLDTVLSDLGALLSRRMGPFFALRLAGNGVDVQAWKEHETMPILSIRIDALIQVYPSTPDKILQLRQGLRALCAALPLNQLVVLFLADLDLTLNQGMVELFSGLRTLLSLCGAHYGEVPILDDELEGIRLSDLVKFTALRTLAVMGVPVVL
ncbi:hypothetical protein H0H81_002024 [Sphagnurus paluster]|uniref:F-box domain-containing protein n=1 Tax=Sphagnurus paluster TaxID=117069 RepID=A0A9P7FPJ9_9AGAR|nr:hypothetical protein H0H81_002024 [Sphagnurus paluster]